MVERHVHTVEVSRSNRLEPTTNKFIGVVMKIKLFILSILNLGLALFLFGFTNNNGLELGFLEKTIIFLIAILGIIGLFLLLIETIQKIFRGQAWLTEILKNWYAIKTDVDIFFIIFLLIRLFFIQPFLVEGESMWPTLNNGDYIIAEKLSYKLKEPQRGDIIVFHPPQTQFSDSNKIYIKRIIGLPFETVEIKNGKVYIYNSKHPEGIELKEPYLPKDFFTLGWQKRQLGKDEYFVLGDNRGPNKSSDSREWGPVLKNKIIGKAIIRLLPIEKFTVFSTPIYNLGFIFNKIL